MTPLHSSLGNKSETPSQNNNNNKNKNNNNKVLGVCYMFTAVLGIVKNK